MGMSNDNHEREELVQKPKIFEVKQPEKPMYNIVSEITINGVNYQLLSDMKTNKWYKAKKIGEYRIDKMNRTPLVSQYGEIEDLTEEDKNYFK